MIRWLADIPAVLLCTTSGCCAEGRREWWAARPWARA